MPEANDNAATASLTSLAVHRSRFTGMTPLQQAQACMRQDVADLDAVVRTDTRPPSPAGTNEDLDIPPHPRQPDDANDWNATVDTATTETLQISIMATTVPAIARGPTPPVSEAGSYVQVRPTELQPPTSDQASDNATAPFLTPLAPETNTSGDGMSDSASALSASWQQPDL